jgi:NAD(P)-dependent dehydrogenase (short-subunit alcohol dehydrogenase family)
VATEQWLGSEGVAATLARAAGAQPYDVADRVAKQAITGRFTQPAEVAYLVLMLASNRTGNITGADFVIDGGLTVAR